MIGIITNGSFLDGNSDDGLRACLESEFNYIYIFNLRGNTRTSGEMARKEGGQFFGSRSRAPIAISILVKCPQQNSLDALDSEKNPVDQEPRKAQILYYDIGDYKSRQEKLNILNNLKSIEGIESHGLWTRITPNKDYDWINQRDYSFMDYIPLGETKNKLKPLTKDKDGKIELEIFELFSQGVVTGKDAWSFNFSKENLA